ncbi:type II toxin-antitoxin system HicB family antitoxin [Antarcticirhabdus aurantiaca]|uniref:type II toxin-antitoxin system HicB family antitoxin n=1 Tax=Antarcticirhabdus aurantiaca TaxID=2606717 RepID=UPI00131B8753|nr:type II toxin-antitoxin system HicB family antitoxin [Antarcticirhabdus aurantiaca]
MQYAYRASFEPEDDDIRVVFPDVPEVTVDAPDRAAALASAREALGLALRGYVEAGEPLPEPRATAGEVIAVSVADALKIAVILAFRSAGITKTELARRLGKRETEARRILDPHHPTGLPLLEAALAVLGKQAVLDVRDAA